MVYALVFFVAVNNLQRPEAVKTVALVLVFLAMAISAYAIYQYASGSDRVWGFVRPEQYAGRGSGTYICPNHLAGFLELVLPLGLAFTVMGRVGVVQRILVGYASLVILAGLGVTLSRGGWLAACASLPFLFAAVFTKRSFRLQALAGLVLVALAGAAFYSGTDRAQKRLDRMLHLDSQSSVLFRMGLWEPAYQMWHDAPWWGVGPGHFDYRFPAYRPPQVQARPGHAHNDYLNLLADWGVAGFALVGAVWVCLFTGALQTWRRLRGEGSREDRGSNRAVLVVGASAGLVALLVHALFDFNFHIPANAITAVLLMGLVTIELGRTTDRYWTGRSWVWKGVATVGIGVAVVWTGHSGWRQWQEARWLERARLDNIEVSTRLASLEQAWSVDPLNPQTAYEMGEVMRLVSWQGAEDYADWARRSIPWFERAMALNPYDPAYPLRIGMCLDWLGRKDEALGFFQKAVALDPNSYYVQALVGWHYVQIGEYAEARPWLQRSIALRHAWKNPIAESHLRIVDQKLKEKSGKSTRR
jgi:O-antigen ligase